MQIAIIKDNAVETMGEHKELFPNVGFPGGQPTDSWMSANSVMPLIRYHSYNILTEKLVDVDPYIESGVVYLSKVEALTDSEKAAAEKDAANPCIISMTSNITHYNLTSDTIICVLSNY